MAKHEWTPSTLGHGTQMCLHCKATDAELAALGELDRCPALMDELSHGHSIDTRLRIALGRFEVYLGSDLTADDRQLIHSTAVALEAVEGKVTLPRHHVLQTIRAFVGEMEQTTMENAEIDEARNAYADLCRQWGVLHPGGDRHQSAPRPVHAAALAGHLATLIELHHDDDREQQHADPVLEAFHPPELSSLRLKTESGRHFMVSVIELPA